MTLSSILTAWLKPGLSTWLKSLTKRLTESTLVWLELLTVSCTGERSRIFSVCLLAWLVGWLVGVFIYLFNYLFISSFIYLSIHLFVSLFVCVPVRLSVCPSVCLSAYLISQSICLFACWFFFHCYTYSSNNPQSQFVPCHSFQAPQAGWMAAWLAGCRFQNLQPKEMAVRQAQGKTPQDEITRMKEHPIKTCAGCMSRNLWTSHSKNIPIHWLNTSVDHFLFDSIKALEESAIPLSICVANTPED